MVSEGRVGYQAGKFFPFDSLHLSARVAPVHALRLPLKGRKHKGLKYGGARVISRKMYVPVNTSVAVMKQSRQLVWS